MKMIVEMSLKQSGMQVRTGLQGGRDATKCEECYRYYDQEYYGKNQLALKLGRNYCCTDKGICDNSQCIRDINTTAEEYFA